MKLPSLDSSTFSQLLGVVSDVSLVMDLQGVIEDVSTGRDTLAALGCQAWVGRSWIDTVTTESRIKIQEMLQSQGAADTMRGAGVKSSVWMLMVYRASAFRASLMPSLTPTSLGSALSAAAASLSL